MMLPDTRRFFVLGAVLVLAASCTGKERATTEVAPDWRSKAPISIPYLLQRDYSSSLEVSRELGEFAGYSSYAVEWDSDGLRQSAYSLRPIAAGNQP